MEPIRQKEDEIFSAALERPTAERAAYLAEACGDDLELRRRVEELLAAQPEVDSGFLESPAPGLTETMQQATTDFVGVRIGPYKLLQQLGQGGMGVVYMAEQSEPVKRRVAIKIIKPGMDSRQVIARFEAERQALALMDHPNIAKVLDAGTTEAGRPYFVMELVKGISVTKYCDEQHLTPRERLELFIPVCQAVQHAHQKGIIHRDLKPSNVLVALYDGEPVPKVIDFGVAKATGQQLTEKTMFTAVGQIVGTFEYMSPEQAQVNQLDVDTRSDIYSLGVLLYELLTGVTPLNRARLRSAALDEMMRIIREEEPPRPSMRLSTIDTLPSVAANRRIEPKKLRTLVRGELDWIVMKALEKDRARRYETANGFAADIQSYLDDEPVVACPPSASYRFRKFARRNKKMLLTGGILAAVLLFGLLGTASQWRVAVSALELARKETKRADDQREFAEQTSADLKLKSAELERQLRRSTVMRLATESHSLRDSKPGLGLLLAIEAIERSRLDDDAAFPAAHEALLNASQLIPGRALIGHSAPITDLVLTTERLVTLGGSTVRIWTLLGEEEGRSMAVLGGEGNRIDCMAISENGRWLFTGGASLQRWDLNTRDPSLASLTLATSIDANDLGLSPDGRWLLTVSRGSEVKLWDLSSSDPADSQVVGKRHQNVVEVAISPDGRWAAIRSSEEHRKSEVFDLTRVELWDLTSGDSSPQPLGNSRRLHMSRDSRFLVTGGKEVRAPTLESDGEVTEINHWVAPSPQLLSPNGRWLFSAGVNQPEIHRWDLLAVEPAASELLLEGHKDGIDRMAMSRDGRWLASGSHDGSVLVWDMKLDDTPALSLILKGHDAPMQAISVSPEGNWLATASAEGVARLWNLRAADPASSPLVLRDHAGTNFTSTAISSDGRLVATVADENAVQLWEWDHQNQEAKVHSRRLLGHTGRVVTVAMTEDDRWLVTGSVDGTARLWQLPDPDLKAPIILDQRLDDQEPKLADWGGYGDGRVALDATGRWLAMAGADLNIRLWDLNANAPSAPPRTLVGHSSRIVNIKISPDGRWLASGATNEVDGRSRVILWDLQSRDPQSSRRYLPGHTRDRVDALVFDRTSTWLAASGGGDKDSAALLWNLRSEDPSARPRVISANSTASIWCMAISPGGHWLFTKLYTPNPHLLDLTAKELKPLELPGGTDLFQWAAFSPDGRWLATGGRVESRLWDLASPDKISTARVLRGHVKPVWDVKFSADSKWLVTDSSDGTVRRWCLDVEWLLDYARKVAGRQLTDEERKQYLIEKEA